MATIALLESMRYAFADAAFEIVERGDKVQVEFPRIHASSGETSGASFERASAGALVEEAAGAGHASPAAMPRVCESPRGVRRARLRNALAQRAGRRAKMCAAAGFWRRLQRVSSLARFQQ